MKSENIIDQCIKSIDNKIPIIVVENSNNENFKNNIEFKYKNVTCVLSGQNLGMGAGNNIGIKKAKTEYVYVLNPDVILETETLNEIYKASQKLKDFSIISPLNTNRSFPNFIKEKDNQDMNSPFEVKYIDGFSMIIDKKKFKDNIFFDENYFLYLENNDLCLKTRKNGGKIIIIPSSKINHIGANTVDSRYKVEIELSRNWHWMWSKFYFNKKNFSFWFAMKECFPSFLKSLIKFLFYFCFNNNKKKKYFNRASGFYNAFIGKSSWYRPKIND